MSINAVNNQRPCEIIPGSQILKLRGTDKMYQDAVEASAKFNKRLFNERRMRMPFIDSQTRVAQTNSMIWMNDSHRTNNFEDRQRGFIYSYQNRKWYKPRRHLFETNDQLNRNNQQSSATLSSMQSTTSNEPHQNGSAAYNLHTSSTNGTLHASNSMNTVNFMNENSNSMDSSTFQVNRVANNTSSLAQVSSSATLPVDDYHVDEWQLNSHNIEDSFDNEPNNENDDSDQDDYEDSKRKGKKKASKKKTRGTTNGSSSIDPNEDKPFVCEKCGVKYKTKPGLSYHVQKAHGYASAAAMARQLTHESSMNPDGENTTNSAQYESNGYDDMNSQSSNMSHMNQHQTTNFSLNNSNLNSRNFQIHSSNKCGICYGTENEVIVAVRTAETPVFSAAEKKFITCSECVRPFHPICLNFTHTMASSTKKYKWQCIDCKKCTVCGNSENDDQLLFCDECDRGYHMYCLKPPLSEAPDGEWKCVNCT